VRDVLGEDLWSGQKWIANAVVEHDRVVVKSSRSTDLPAGDGTVRRYEQGDPAVLVVVASDGSARGSGGRPGSPERPRQRRGPGVWPPGPRAPSGTVGRRREVIPEITGRRGAYVPQLPCPGERTGTAGVHLFLWVVAAGGRA
jgi:hypothetical protein